MGEVWGCPSLWLSVLGGCQEGHLNWGAAEQVSRELVGRMYHPQFPDEIVSLNLRVEIVSGEESECGECEWEKGSE